MVLISERPQEAAGRAVPAHWEGDLIVGKDHKSAIGTLVERSSRYLVLVHLPLGYTSGHTRDGLINAIQTFPPQLRRSLAWDQGAEMAMHKAVTTATGVPVYFCNPGSPWQRGSNENTNGLLRQYFPKGTDLSRHGHEELDAVAAALNNRPRKTLGWETRPSVCLNCSPPHVSDHVLRRSLEFAICPALQATLCCRAHRSRSAILNFNLPPK